MSGRDMQKIELLISQHNPKLVLLAATICFVGSWIALTLLQQTQAKDGHLRTRWQLATAISVGVTIWCTHFTAMMAFNPGEWVNLDMGLTMMSLVVAVLAAGFAIWVSFIPRFRFAPEVGGIFAGLGVSAMHYTGMTAYQLTSPVTWSPLLIAASVAFAVAFGAFAFNQILRSPRGFSGAIGKIAFALAIVTLHFTGMAAMDFVCSSTPAYNGPDTFTPMGIAIGTVGLLTIINSLSTQLIETRGSRESLQRLQRMALTDILTGLPNRAHFNEEFDSMLQTCRKSDSRLAVVGIDLDRFKEINDLRGHAAGDEALRIIGGRLSRLSSSNSFFARLGGDEFAAAIAFDDDRQLRDLIGKIEEQLFHPLLISGIEAATGASTGVAIFPDHGSDRERLMANADIAMYRAKKTPGQTVCFFEAHMETAAHERHELSHDLRRALERDQFALHYQVQTSIETGQTLGYEALLRWKHPEKGLN
ncbi:MAG: diguanylate cyclase [Rhizobium sp.]